MKIFSIHSFKKFLPFIGAITVCIMIFTTSIFITLNSRSLYYDDIAALNLSEKTGLSSDKIAQNFDDIIDYITDSSESSLNLTSFKSSQKGLIHFKETKAILSLNKYLMIFSSALCILFIFIGTKNRSLSFMVYGGASSLILTSLILTFCAFDFDSVFQKFHSILFSNNYWLFSPAEDPVITILPQEFFLHCIVLISIIVVAYSLLFMVIGRDIKKRGYI